MSNELEDDRAMVMKLEGLGVDGAGYDDTEAEPPSSTNPQWGSWRDVKIMPPPGDSTSLFQGC